MKSVFIFTLLVNSFSWAGSSLREGKFIIEFPSQSQAQINQGYASFESALSVKSSLDQAARESSCQKNNYEAEVLPVAHDLEAYFKLVTNFASARTAALFIEGAYDLRKLMTGKYYIKIQLTDETNYECFGFLHKVYVAVFDSASSKDNEFRAKYGYYGQPYGRGDGTIGNELFQRSGVKEEIGRQIVSNMEKIVKERCPGSSDLIPASKKSTYASGDLKGSIVAPVKKITDSMYTICIYDPVSKTPQSSFSTYVGTYLLPEELVADFK